LQADISLESLLPEISSEITIEGDGHFVSGEDYFPMFSVASAGSLTLREATVKDGVYSGGIHNTGTVTLVDSAVSGNRASSSGGGIYNSGTATLVNSIVSGNQAADSSDSYGGGIYNDSGTVTLTNSTVIGNSTSGEHAYGAGIYNLAGTVTLTNSAVSGNSDSCAYSYGVGIYNDGGEVVLTDSVVSGNTATGTFSYGAGIYSTGAVTLTNSAVSGNTASNQFSSGGGIYNSTITGTVTLTNSTVSGNRISGREAFGGGISNSGAVTLTNSTISGNEAYGIYTFAGGIYNGGAVTLRSSVISGNEAGKGKEIYNYNIVNADSVDADSFNVFGHAGKTSAQAFSGFTPGSSDVNAASDGGTPTELAAILSPLADNGGPTQTHALPACSPAVNLDKTCGGGTITTDQRGVSRPSGAGCDAGAFEFNGKPRGCGAANMTPIYKLLLLHQR
jgi:hypothetical protein